MSLHPLFPHFSRRSLTEVIWLDVYKRQTFTSVSTQWLPTIIRKFQADYPLVEFDLLAGDYDEITERILSGRVDCGFLTAPVADPLIFHLLYKDPMNVLLPVGHPLTKHDVPVSYTHLSDLSYVKLSPSPEEFSGLLT